MNLYKISQIENNDWDTYDGAIVCAETANEARCINPDDSDNYNVWIHPTKVHQYVYVELIGKALENTQKGVVLASFNAG